MTFLIIASIIAIGAIGLVVYDIIVSRKSEEDEETQEESVEDEETQEESVEETQEESVENAEEITE